MYSYITQELPRALYEQFKNLDSSRVSIMGHSMGGHGALTLFLKNPGMYKSVSAFSPISNPKNCPWGEKAFGGYLKTADEYDNWDATELIKKWGGDFEALIDVVSALSGRDSVGTDSEQGDADNFYKQGQLLPENFVEAAKAKGKADKIDLRIQKVESQCTIYSMMRKLIQIQGYDHSYFFISTFSEDHINYHAKHLLQ